MQRKNGIIMTSGTLFKTFGLLIVIRMIFGRYFSETFGIIYLILIAIVGAMAYAKTIKENKSDTTNKEDELADN